LTFHESGHIERGKEQERQEKRKQTEERTEFPADHRPRKQPRKQPNGFATPKSAVQKRQAPPPPTGTIRLEHVLSVKCAKLGLAMLDGTKVVENRKYQLQLGWHLVYISKARNLNDLEDFKSLIDELDYPQMEQEECPGKVIGGIYIAEIRAKEACNEYPWAQGPHCHIISHTLTLPKPVEIQKPNRGSVMWQLRCQTTRQMIEEQMPEMPTAMNLLPINGPQGGEPA
jgi:hypothetical protein